MRSLPANFDLNHLKALIRAVENPAGRERYAFTQIPEGLPRGAVTEITGFGKTECVVQFLAENKDLRVAWVEEELTIYPLALEQRAVRLQRLLFIEAQRELNWVVFQTLRSGLFECVIVTTKKSFDERTLRRFQLEAEKAHVGLILLTEKTHKAWPISLQLAVNKDKQSLKILKER